MTQPPLSALEITPYPGYQLRELLGQGSHTQVWEADTADGRLVALKFLPCADSRTAAAQIRSIQTYRALQHPYLVGVEHVWFQPGYVVVVMERATASLADVLRVRQANLGTVLPADEVCGYLESVAEALDFLNTRQHQLHGQCVGFQHGQVKPSNLLLFGDSVKLADFGLATTTTALLRVQGLAEAMPYVAPEMLAGQTSDWSDQYALAVAYCQLRSGRAPFPAPVKLERGYVRPDADLTMLSPAERPALARSLALVPRERWPSCRELLAQVRAALVGAHALASVGT